MRFIVVNSIDIQIEFSYKGETLRPRATLDLDDLMERHGGMPDLHRYLAVQNQIDTYSYLYETMESYDIAFANARGVAAEFFDGEQFDWSAFERRWREMQEYRFLYEVAERHLGIHDLDTQPHLLAALREAYEVGKSKA